jgi:threonine-phosphate decarboxylase
MQAIILAAGRGSRLSKYTRNGPKCFLPIKYGQMVIERQLSQLEKNNFHHVIVVLGYRAERGHKIIQEIRGQYPGLDIRTVVNRDYHSTGTLASLLIGYLALEAPGEPFFIVEGDVVYDDEMILHLLNGTGNRLGVDYSGLWDEESMKCQVVEGNVISLSKALDINKADGEYVNLGVIDGREFEQILPVAREYLSNKPLAFYDDFFHYLLQRGDDVKFSAVDIQDLRWTEIDFPDEYKRARQIFAEEVEVEIDSSLFHQSTHSPSVLSLVSDVDVEIKDFCFLANPYLLNDPIVKESLSWELPSLLATYPPEQAQLQKTMATFHNNKIQPENVLVTNGATEAIKLLKSLCDHLIVPVPTFSEYLNVPQVVTPYRLLLENGFDLPVTDFVDFYQQSPADGVVLINPNNPAGRLLSKDEVEAIISACADRLVIVDESLIEFSDDSQSVLDRLDTYPNLVVVKSYGTILGIPGIRLGALFASTEIISQLFSSLPVWNVNTIAAFFLNMILNARYQVRYHESIQQVRIATNQLFRGLSMYSDYLQAFQPAANFVFARLTNGMTSTELRDQLLKHRIYIRDCEGKLGLDGSYVRIVSRTLKDNANLVRHLGMILADRDLAVEKEHDFAFGFLE